MTQQTGTPHTCNACTVLDGADGTVDGHFVAVPGVRTQHAGRHFAHIDAERVGQLSEKFARFLGTGRYLFWQTLFVIVWITLNLAAVSLRWDPYPFILLNLAFSTQAAYAAPLILLAQNRDNERQKVRVDLDFGHNARAEVWAVHIGAALGIDATHVEAIVQQAINEAGAAQDGVR